MEYTATITELYSVTWPKGEDGNGSTTPIYFENKKDAESAALIQRGDWNSKGSVGIHTYINGKNSPPKAFSTIRDWSEISLTVAEARKHGLI